MIRENKFDGYLRADPHDHIREFLAICNMFRYGETQSEAIKLLIFPFSLYDKAKTWFNKVNEESITSGDQMRDAFINRFFPPLLFNHESTQAILEVTVGGIFLYKCPNQVFQLLEDKVLFNLDWSIKSKIKHHQRSVSFVDGSNSDVDNSLLLEKLEALTIKMDSQFQSLKEEMHEMRKNYNNREGDHASKNDDTPMCERHEANYIQSEGNKNQNSQDSYSYQSHCDRNDSEKSLTELNNEVKNDLEDFKRCIHSMRIDYDKLYDREEMINLRNSNQDPPIDFYDLKGSDEGDNEIISLIMEPFNTFLMGDEVISIILERENDEFIKSSVDNLVPIPREEKYFDINSPLGEQVVDFLMENVDVAGLPRHLVRRLFSHLLKYPSLTKGIFDEPLGDDSKPKSYNVTFSNPLFDFNDDYTLYYDNLLFDEEFEDISSLDPPKSAPMNHEPLGNPDSVSRSLETSNLSLEELATEIGLEDSILTEIYDGYYDSEGDILFLEHLLIEETFFDPTPAVLPKESTLLVTPLPDSKEISLRKVEIFDPFFSLTRLGGKTRVMETLLLVFIICHHPVLLDTHQRR
nr:hypothetical protein [Tanacetum cinerariifolium]